MDQDFSSIVLGDRRRLSFLERGAVDAPAVFYFHGAGASALAQPPEDSAALAGVRLIAVERPGIGGSDPSPHRRIGGWPSDVGELADHLSIDRFSVLGWSAGGPHALACAAALPERVVSCGVLFGALPIGWSGWEDGLAPELVGFCALAVESPGLLRDALRPMVVDPEAFLLTFLERDESAAPLLADDRVVDQVRADARRAFAQGPDAMLLDCTLIYSPWDFDLADVRVPVKLTYGREDQTCPPAWGARLASQLPSAELVVLDGVGHNHGYDAGVFRAALESLVEVADASA